MSGDATAAHAQITIIDTIRVALLSRVTYAGGWMRGPDFGTRSQKRDVGGDFVSDNRRDGRHSDGPLARRADRQQVVAVQQNVAHHAHCRNFGGVLANSAENKKTHRYSITEWAVRHGKSLTQAINRDAVIGFRCHYVTI
jgi:hypothetical protein